MANVTSVEAHVDGLTATLAVEAGVAARERFRMAVYGAQRVCGPREEPKPCCWMNFIGRKQGGVFYGNAESHAAVQALGKESAVAFAAIKKCGARASRVDLAADIWFDQDYLDFARLAEPGALEARSVGGGAARRRVTMICGNGHGDTLQLGSRASNQFGRLYDKWRESGKDEYRNCWRAEVEFKGPDAVVVANVLWANDALPREILSIVARWWEERGVSLPVGGWGCSDGGVDFSRKPTDAETAERWLANQVRPTVGRLVVLLGRQRVLDVLGLDSIPDDLPKG